MTPLLWSRGESATDWAGLGPTTVLHDNSALLRLWRGFVTARRSVALVLIVLQLVVRALGQPVQWLPIAVSVGYLFVTLLGPRLVRFTPPIRTIGFVWLANIGIDLAVFAALQLMQPGSVNYTPLFALPVLLGAVLGTLAVSLGTSALVTLALLAEAGWSYWLQPGGGDAPTRFVQAALTGTGLFVVALLAHELSRRLAREEALSLRSRSRAQLNAQVNEVVIETLSEGVMVVDGDGRVHAANPAAAAMLGHGVSSSALPSRLDAHPAWEHLAELAQQTFVQRLPQARDVPVAQLQGAPREVSVRTRLAAGGRGSSRSDEDGSDDADEPGLCVMFMQDLRELEARIRTEKLAAMGRMSAAVAHEIRNPLAAITQASGLLAEDLVDPAQRRLTDMVQHNAQRLARIVDDVLDAARARQQRALPPGDRMALDAAVRTLTEEWVRQAQRQGVLLMLDTGGRDVPFDVEHLRRILVNLLDNAARYAGEREGSIQISTGLQADGRALLQVWSDGAPLEPAVQRHLFEPFFSSESRSSGLGLFICRELCERHGATLGYERHALLGNGPPGNDFFVSFAAMPLTQ